jgi:hypothetical protein
MRREERGFVIWTAINLPANGILVTDFKAAFYRKKRAGDDDVMRDEHYSPPAGIYF